MNMIWLVMIRKKYSGVGLTSSIEPIQSLPTQVYKQYNQYF